MYLVSNRKCHLSFSFTYGDFFFCTKVKKKFMEPSLSFFTFIVFPSCIIATKPFTPLWLKRIILFACTRLRVCTFRSTWSLLWHTVWDLYLVLSFPNSYLVVLGCILSPCLFTYMQSTSCEMLGWMKRKLESRLLEEISITSYMQMIPPLWQKVKRN